MEHAFFDREHYIIDEKVNPLGISNNYLIRDETGKEIGSVRMVLSFGGRIIRLLAPKSAPFLFEILDEKGHVLLKLRRGWTWFFSTIEVLTPEDRVFAHIQQRFTFFKPRFDISDVSGQPKAVILGDWAAWSFEIQTPHGVTIGAVNKRWAGLAREFFTTADKYQVEIEPALKQEPLRSAIVACAVAVDMILKETKNQ